VGRNSIPPIEFTIHCEKWDEKFCPTRIGPVLHHNLSAKEKHFANADIYVDSRQGAKQNGTKLW